MYYLLAIDGGGTKTVGQLYCPHSGQRWQGRAGPAQLTNDYASARQNVYDLCQQLLTQAGVEPAQIVAIIGLAGAGNPSLHHAFLNDLALPFAAWQLTTDARISLYGANLGHPVAVVAIGTGSVGMRLQADGTELQVGGWGFTLGDEGGGAWLGKLLVRALLWQLDWQRPLTPLLQATGAICGTNVAAILPWLKQATASDFAALAPLVYHYTEPLAEQLRQQQAQAIAELARCSLADQALPLVFLGGLAEQCLPYLSESLRQHLQPAKGDALAGGLALAATLAASLSHHE
ncbi:BadF/BadG/BcrA/BcrD ATPase family protein [Alishewanella tabrizica]|uniref:N-acetylglucosamine kinase n=1 Tax=Alishewanella tabrizica TaxID=671278 RepID=A0ABQ2WU36_9ALTE|nr:BadF/BadG/BcrA/BcrD ATPase family protein [Alishewanella tabrizica]GGW71946.1 N-acetylglucosamine kinase [Alishewanella tabrizica]